MNSKDRMNAVLNFQKPDRLPVIEWAPYWDQTVKRWQKEGMNIDIENHHEVREYFGLDPLVDLWVPSRGKNCPKSGYGQAMIKNSDDYARIRKHLFTEETLGIKELEYAAKMQDEKGAALFCWIWGYFWTPRELFGIEGHLYAFYDCPELMNRINDDQYEFIIKTIDRICKYASLQFIVLGEDMSYKTGSMISKALFDEFLAPYYAKTAEYIKSRGIKAIIDSDGLVDEPLQWYKKAGFEGMLPMERQAGVDIAEYREKYPDIIMIGGFDKRCMSGGEAAMRKEFERILPVMRRGGYIPGVDHQTPPEVSLEDYRLYLRLLREYCRIATT